MVRHDHIARRGGVKDPMYILRHPRQSPRLANALSEDILVDRPLHFNNSRQHLSNPRTRRGFVEIFVQEYRVALPNLILRMNTLCHLRRFLLGILCRIHRRCLGLFFGGAFWLGFGRNPRSFDQLYEVLFGTRSVKGPVYTPNAAGVPAQALENSSAVDIAILRRSLIRICRAIALNSHEISTLTERVPNSTS